MAKRVGCYYCFKILDPKDKQDNLQTFVKCLECHHIYHSACWDICGKCSYCGNSEYQSVKVSRPAPLRAVTKIQAISITPSKICNLDDETIWEQGFLGKRFFYFAQLTRAIVVIIFLLVLAIFIGVFTDRISQLDPVTATIIMDAIFKQALPPINTFIGAVFSGIVFVLLFYKYSPTSKPAGTTQPSSENQDSSQTPPPKIKEGKDPMARLLAGIVAIIAFDFLLFEFSPQNILNFNGDWLLPYREILYAQGTTLLMMLLFIPLHGGLAPITPLPKVNHSQLFTNLYGLIRLLIASLLLSLFVAYLSTYKLPSGFNEPVFSTLSFGSFTVELTLPMLGAFVAGIAIASIFYWPPKCRQVKWRFGFLRLLVVVLCVVAFGLMYRSAETPLGLFNAVIVASVAMFILTPVQYAFS